MHFSFILAFLLPTILLFSMLPPTTEGTFEIIIPGVVALSAAQVTLLAALKVLGVTAGLLLSRRNRRSVLDNRTDDPNLVTLTSSLEPEECFQLLFCTLATMERVAIDNDVLNIYNIVTKMPGKYKEAHKFGGTGYYVVVFDYITKIIITGKCVLPDTSAL